MTSKAPKGRFFARVTANTRCPTFFADVLVDAFVENDTLALYTCKKRVFGIFAGRSWECPFSSFSRFFARVSANIRFCNFLALFFCSFTHIYDERAMLFSALYVVIPFFQRLSANIAIFTFFRQKYKKSTAFISIFVRWRDRFFDRCGWAGL